MDIQIIIDAEMCPRYMAKYASKGEPRSQPVSSIFKSCVDRLNSTSHAHTALRSAMIRSVAERDFSAQETAHQLLSLPLFSSSFNFVALSLNGSSLLTTDNHSGEQKILLQYYATRTSLPNINLANFVSNYSVHNGEIQKHPSPFIVRCFPQYSSNPHDERYAQYCKYQLIKYTNHGTIPSRMHGNDYLALILPSYIEVYKSFLRTPEAEVCVPHFADELNRAEQHITQSESSDSEDELPATEQREEWMLLCHLNHHYTASSQQDDSINWSEAAQSLPPEILRDCPRWIKMKRQESDANPCAAWNRQLPPIDVGTLNTNQNKAYDIICRHHQQLLANNKPTPLCMMICGTAGTGKSYLISAIAQKLGSLCILTATT